MSSDQTSKGLSLFQGGLSVTDPESDERNLRRNLGILRDQFQNNQAIRECLTAATREERKQGVLHFNEMMAFAPGGMESFEKALDHMLEELEQMQVAGHGQYLVDERTGKVVAPLTKDLVYTTPDFVNEAGQLVKGKPVINPGFASALGLAQQEQERTKTAIAKAGGWAGHAVEHLKDPDSILRHARELLAAAGVRELAEGEASEEAVFEVGKEQVDGVFQSPNTMFHRTHVFANVLARRIVTDGRKACTLSAIELKQNSKVRWYEVKALVLARSEASEASAPTP